MASSKPLITVFLMSYNRPDYVSDALNSIVNQTIDNSLYKIIVSDNSSNEEGIFKVIEEHKDIFHYIKRTPSIDVISHHKKLIEENTTKYFMMFHDDDIMMPTMLESLLDKIKTNNYAAVGCNAFVLKNTVKTNKLYNRNPNDIVFKNGSYFLTDYLLGNYVHPFPGFMYNKKYYSSINMDLVNGGRFADVLFITSGIVNKPLFCIGKPLFYYRVKLQNYVQGDFLSRVKLVNKINNNCGLNIRKPLIDMYRIRNILSRLKVQKGMRIISSRAFRKIVFYNINISFYLIYKFIKKKL